MRGRSLRSFPSHSTELKFALCSEPEKVHPRSSNRPMFFAIRLEVVVTHLSLECTDDMPCPYGLGETRMHSASSEPGDFLHHLF